MDDYIKERNKLLKTERIEFTGGNIVLTPKENKINDILLRVKMHELDEGYKNSSNFLPSKHFYESKKGIENSKVFGIIKSLPKGGSLHTHMLASVSVDFIMEKISYLPDLYAGYINGNFKLRFFAKESENITFKPLSEYRLKDNNFNNWLRSQLTLENESYPTVIDIWTKFKKIFTTMYDMICYRPVFEIYIYQLLNELLLDNVMYVELKGTFMPLYELNGRKYNTIEFFETYISTVEKFKLDHPDFIGVKYIHSVYRGVSKEELKSGLDELLQLKNIFPNFIAGFDFVGYEEEGNTLLYYKDELLYAQNKGIKLFFHAGETNWFGSTDLNLADAILLNCTRIGHGFSLPKHPTLFEEAQQRNIPIELCPISNQVLKLNEDPRNHPGNIFLAKNYPVVIGNDDPALWGATGLSFDWYIVFMAMTPRDKGLEVLKQLALNSITYSAMSQHEKDMALEKWHVRWNIFLDKYLKKDFC